MVAAQAQAQAQRQDEITAQASAELVKALLRVSIYHVSYLRGIFPDDHYKPVDMRNLDNMEIHMLLPKDPESERLVQWVEGGVTHALERRYLRKVFFGFSRDAAGKDLLEEYVFSFNYDEDGSVTMAAGGSSRNGRSREFSTKDMAPKGKGPTLSAVKYQVCRLMRMLVELTNTLEEVPEERYLFMKLTYTGDTPEEYEPPMFGPATDGGVGCFSRMPFVMNVGSVDTCHIKVGLAVKTVLDNVEADWEEDGHHLPVADDNSNLFQTTEAAPTAAASAGDAPSKAVAARGQQAKGHKGSAVAAAAAGSAGGAGSRGRADSAEDESMDGGFSCAPAKGRPAVDKEEVLQKRPDSASQQGGQLSQRQHAELAAVRDWVVVRPQGEVHVVDVLARFSSVPTASVGAYFERLQSEGVLVPTDQTDCYRVTKPGAASAVPKRVPAGKLPSASPVSEAALQEAEAAMQALRVAPMDSRQGGVHEVPGSQRTMSVAGGKRRASADAWQDEDEEAMVFPETQPSFICGDGRSQQRRKASYVEKPIEQKRRKTAQQQPAAAAPAVQQQQQPVRRSTRRR